MDKIDDYNSEIHFVQAEEKEDSRSETELVVTLCESPHRSVKLIRLETDLNAFNSLYAD